MTIIHDISMLIEREMPVYKNREEKRPELTVVRHHGMGQIHESRLQLDLHCGTHLDAPLHVLKDGDTIEKIEPANLLRTCKVLDLTAVPAAITRAELEKQELASGDFILFKTRNSDQDNFDAAFVYLEKSGALYLARKGIAGVGIDSLGIERDQPGYETHKALFSAGIMILEGLRLAGVAPGPYYLVALPLKIKGAEASPLRAILLEKEGIS